MNVSGHKRPPSVPCPTCESRRTWITNTRASKDGLYRRRECVNGHRFNTEETARKYATATEHYNILRSRKRPPV